MGKKEFTKELAPNGDDRLRVFIHLEKGKSRISLFNTSQE
jgi:hypothetical protein